MFSAEPESPSLVEKARTRGLPLRRWALAAMVTQLSVMPWASFARVLPVQGAITSASSGSLGPRGSASDHGQDATAPKPKPASPGPAEACSPPGAVDEETGHKPQCSQAPCSWQHISSTACSISPSFYLYRREKISCSYSCICFVSPKLVLTTRALKQS